VRPHDLGRGRVARNGLFEKRPDDRSDRRPLRVARREPMEHCLGGILTGDGQEAPAQPGRRLDTELGPDDRTQHPVRELTSALR
jgi:hypothetical protein